MNYLRCPKVLLLALLLGWQTAGFSGCAEGDGGRPDREAMSPAEYFNQTQGGTVTPDGRVVPDSAHDVGDGRVQYETDAGGTFEVTAVPTEEGGYRYTDVRRREP